MHAWLDIPALAFRSGRACRRWLSVRASGFGVVKVIASRRRKKKPSRLGWAESLPLRKVREAVSLSHRFCITQLSARGTVALQQLSHHAKYSCRIACKPGEDVRLKFGIKDAVCVSARIIDAVISGPI